MRKAGILAITGVIASALLSGCGSGSSPEQQPTGASATPGGSGTAAKQEQVTIKAVVLSEDRATFEKALMPFYEQFPEIKVELMDFPAPEYNDKMAVQLAGGVDYDVFTTPNNPTYVDWISKNQLMPLDDFIKKDQFDVSGYGPLYESGKVDGKLYGLPYRKSTWVMFYNKTLFDQAKVPYPASNWTWDDFRSTAKALTKGSGNDKIWGAYLHTWPQTWYGMGLQTGAGLADEDLSAFQTALDLRVKLEEDGSIMKYTESKATNAHYSTEFQKGKSAMVPIGDWFIPMLRKLKQEGKVGFEWDIAPLPHPKGSPAGTSWGMPANLVVGQKSKHAQEAWQFVKFMAGEKGAGIFAADSYLTGYINSAIESKYLSVNNQEPANIGIMMKQKLFPEMPAIPGANKLQQIYQEESELTFAGERSVEETFKVIKERIRKEMNK